METNMNSNDNNLLERNYDIDNQYIECIPEEEENAEDV